MLELTKAQKENLEQFIRGSILGDGYIEPIKNNKMLCYLIYDIAGMMIKYNIWFFENQVKENKSFIKIT